MYALVDSPTIRQFITTYLNLAIAGECFGLRCCCVEGDESKSLPPIFGCNMSISKSRQCQWPVDEMDGIERWTNLRDFRSKCGGTYCSTRSLSTVAT